MQRQKGKKICKKSFCFSLDDLLTVDFPLAAKVSEAQQHLKTQYSSESIEKESEALIGPETTGNSHIPFKREILPKEGEKEEEGGELFFKTISLLI